MQVSIDEAQRRGVASSCRNSFVFFDDCFQHSHCGFCHQVNNPLGEFFEVGFHNQSQCLFAVCLKFSNIFTVHW